MGRPKGPPKDPFAGLPSDWKDAVAASTKEEIDKRIAELAKAETENQSAKKEDQDLAEKKLAAKDAGQQYSDNTKGYKLRMKFIMRVLKDKAKA